MNLVSPGHRRFLPTLKGRTSQNPAVLSDVPKPLVHPIATTSTDKRPSLLSELRLQSAAPLHTNSVNDILHAHDDKRTGYTLRRTVQQLIRILTKYLTFVGPGFMIAVAYIDPGNYATDVSAGTLFEYRMLFILLLSNLFAIFLQSLSCKLGCVTGLNLAEHCRAQFPKWLRVVLYIVFEVAILATDLAEVIGCAIALNILFKLPLTAGVAITMVDVLIVLCAWHPDGSMRATRYFELGVSLLVGMVVCCFIALLVKIPRISGRSVIKGYLPSAVCFNSEGIYTSLSIIGAVVMPHSLILGTGLTQPRMRSWDMHHGNISKESLEQDMAQGAPYTPTIGAVKSTLSFSVAEICVSLMTFALFVNSAILITAGSTLYQVAGASDADLFGIHSLLVRILGPAAGVIFAIALLASGQSAGIVTTMAGQMVSEGFFKWTMRPWLRRLITRSLAVLPCIIVAGTVGRSGLSQVLNATQVALSILLPFITFPIVRFTGDPNIMRIATIRDSPSQNPECTGLNGDIHLDSVAPAIDNVNVELVRYVDMRNSRFTQIMAWAIWLVIAGLNLYLIVILAKTRGKGG